MSTAVNGFYRPQGMICAPHSTYHGSADHWWRRLLEGYHLSFVSPCRLHPALQLATQYLCHHLLLSSTASMHHIFPDSLLLQRTPAKGHLWYQLPKHDPPWAVDVFLFEGQQITLPCSDTTSQTEKRNNIWKRSMTRNHSATWTELQGLDAINLLLKNKCFSYLWGPRYRTLYLVVGTENAIWRYSTWSAHALNVLWLVWQFLWKYSLYGQNERLSDSLLLLRTFHRQACRTFSIATSWPHRCSFYILRWQ